MGKHISIWVVLEAWRISVSIYTVGQCIKHSELLVLFTHLVVICRTYRLSQNVKPLIWVECLVERHSRSRTEYMVKARSQFKERSSATNVEILLPLPPDAITPNVRTSQVIVTSNTEVAVASHTHLQAHSHPVLVTVSCQFSVFPTMVRPVLMIFLGDLCLALRDCRVQQSMPLRRRPWCGRSRTSPAVRSSC